MQNALAPRGHHSAHWAAASAAIHSLRTPFPTSIKSFQPGAFQSIESFHESGEGVGGGTGRAGEEEGEQKKKQ